MIWIETLSRNKEVVARVRATGKMATIGRAYDNDVIIDDPHVAPRHMRVRHGEDGALIAEDLGSRNGIQDESGKRRHAMKLTGDTLLRVGQTWLRVRDNTFRIPAERILPPERRLWPWLLLALTLAIGVRLLNSWQTDIFEHSDPVALYVRPLLGFALLASAWITFWAVLTRLLAGQARAGLHAIIALTGFAVVSVAGSLQTWLSFALSSHALADYGFVLIWLLAAAVFHAHLRAIGARHSLRKAVAVLMLALCACLAQWLESRPFSSEEMSDPDFHPGEFYPPSWRITPPGTEEPFFEQLREIEPMIEKLRKHDAELRNTNVSAPPKS
ncbi:MAG: FHA domain-containing protein [Azoarcus sp.]|nr:FHA domain-containing protein [Azoarcus sp.]